MSAPENWNKDRHQLTMVNNLGSIKYIWMLSPGRNMTSFDFEIILLWNFVKTIAAIPAHCSFVPMKKRSEDQTMIGWQYISVFNYSFTFNERQHSGRNHRKWNVVEHLSIVGSRVEWSYIERRYRTWVKQLILVYFAVHVLFSCRYCYKSNIYANGFVMLRYFFG